MPLNQTSCLFQRVCSVLLSLQLEVSTVEKGGRKSVPGCVLGFPGREGSHGVLLPNLPQALQPVQHPGRAQRCLGCDFHALLRYSIVLEESSQQLRDKQHFIILV